MPMTETHLSVHRVHHGGDRIAEPRHLVAEVARGLRELLRLRVLLRVQHADAVRLGRRGGGGGGRGRDESGCADDASSREELTARGREAPAGRTGPPRDGRSSRDASTRRTSSNVTARSSAMVPGSAPAAMSRAPNGTREKERSRDEPTTTSPVLHEGNHDAVLNRSHYRAQHTMSTTATPAPQAFIFTTASGTTIPEPSPNSMTRARSRLEAPEGVPVQPLFPVRQARPSRVARRESRSRTRLTPSAPTADRRAPRERRGRARRQAAQVHGRVTAPSRALFPGRATRESRTGTRALKNETK